MPTAGVLYFWWRRQTTAAGSALRSGALALEPSIYPSDETFLPVDKGADPGDRSNDTDMERARPLHRTSYDHALWRQHRDSRRIFRAAFGLAGSRIMTRISFEVGIVALFTTFICVLQNSRWALRWLTLPTSIFSLSAPALGLLLVFRTNASYSRWEETRRGFGLACTRCQDLARKALGRLRTTPSLQDQFLRYAQAFPFVLKVHVRGGPGGCEDDNNLMDDLRDTLRPAELRLLLSTRHRPAHILQCLSEIVKLANVDTASMLAMDHSLSALADITGACDRIVRTPIPLSYTSLTTRFVSLWLLLLPLALSSDIMRGGHAVWLTIPAVAFIAFLLLGIEEVGVQIEEPFTILPLEVIAETARENIQALIAEQAATSAMIYSQTSMLNGARSKAVITMD